MLGINAARLAVIAFLQAHPNSRVSEVAEGTSLSANTVKKHVSSLASAGLLEVDPPLTVPFEDRRGRQARYAVKSGLLQAYYDELGKQLRIR